MSPLEQISKFYLLVIGFFLQFGTPLMLSWPHFFQADPKILEEVEGLNPRQDRHQFHVDILPAMGVGMRASVTSQVNMLTLCSLYNHVFVRSNDLWLDQIAIIFLFLHKILPLLRYIFN